MKGITPIIALILLLVIVIVVVGFAFGIFQGLISTAGEAAEGQTTTTTEQIQQTVSIENVYYSDPAGDDQWIISVRNQGSSDITPASEVGIYIDDTLENCNQWVPDTIIGDSTATCTINVAALDCVVDDYDIRVTSPSGATQTQTYSVASCT